MRGVCDVVFIGNVLSDRLQSVANVFTFIHCLVYFRFSGLYI